jgi:hypothetical protein
MAAPATSTRTTGSEERSPGPTRGIAQHRIARILSFDRGIDKVPGIERLH